MQTLATTPAPHFINDRQLLPDEARDEVAVWELMMLRMQRACAHGGVKKAALALAEANEGQRGRSPQQIIRRYYSWKKLGWRGLINQVKWGRYLKLDDFTVPPEFVHEWKGAQMKAAGRIKLKSLWRTCVRDRYRAWRAGDVTAALEGFGDKCPDPNPRTGLPAGLSYRNLTRKRYVLTKDELAAAQQGENGAATKMPPVFTDRSQLYFGQYFLFDDIWHDHLVNVDGERGARRPLELHGLELFSGCKNIWGMIPIRENEETGKMERLKQKEMLWLLVAQLARDGYHPNGTTFNCEHGTANVEDRVEQILADATRGLLRIERGGIRGEMAMFAGQYAGVGKGNFKFKAALESLGNLIHNEMQLLPGQVGMGPDHEPSETHGLKKLHNALIKALAALPQATRDVLAFPVMDFAMFKKVAAEIYHRINTREDHNLQGWREAGLTAQEWRAGAQHAWASKYDYLALAKPARAAIDALIASDPATYSKVRDLQPAEVYAQGKASLVKLPNHILCRILGADLAKEVRVRNKLFTFEDREYGPGEQRYLAVVRDNHGHDTLLTEGEKYQLYVTPFWPEGGFVCDAKGAYLGATRQWKEANRADAEALRAQYARVRQMQSAVLNPLSTYGRKLTRERAAKDLHNAGVLGQFTRPHAGTAKRAKRTTATANTPVSRADAALHEELMQATES